MDIPDDTEAEVEVPSMAGRPPIFVMFGSAAVSPAVTLTTADVVAMAKQREVVWDLMSDGSFRTLADIETATSYPQASISARLRDFRKAKFGGYRIDRIRVEGQRTYKYRMSLAVQPAAVVS